MFLGGLISVFYRLRVGGSINQFQLSIFDRFIALIATSAAYVSVCHHEKMFDKLKEPANQPFPVNIKTFVRNFPN